MKLLSVISGIDLAEIRYRIALDLFDNVESNKMPHQVYSNSSCVVVVVAHCSPVVFVEFSVVLSPQSL